MIRLSIASLAALAVAAVVAWRLGGTLGSGVLAGFLLGAGFSGLGMLYQRHVLLTRPERAFIALGISFLAKLLVLLIGGLAFRYVEAAAARADWRSFLVSFVTAVAILLPLGSLDLLASLRRRGTGTHTAQSR